MRHLLSLLVSFVVVVASAGTVLAGGGSAPTLPKPIPLTPTQSRNLRTPLTRATQLAAVRRGPPAMQDLYNKLAGAHVATSGATPAPDLAAWQAGIVLTPLAMSYGQVPGPDSACCWTQCAVIGGGMLGASNLPTAASPFLSLCGAADHEVMLQVLFQPPAVGGYMVTFGVAGLNAPPNIQFCPDLNIISVDAPVTGDQPVPGATHWTVLVSTTGSTPGRMAVLLKVPSGAAPMPCTFSSVTIRKL
jgi:hypothetical protein